MSSPLLNPSTQSSPSYSPSSIGGKARYPRDQDEIARRSRFEERFQQYRSRHKRIRSANHAYLKSENQRMDAENTRIYQLHLQNSQKKQNQAILRGTLKSKGSVAATSRASPFNANPPAKSTIISNKEALPPNLYPSEETSTTGMMANKVPDFLEEFIPFSVKSEDIKFPEHGGDQFDAFPIHNKLLASSLPSSESLLPSPPNSYNHGCLVPQSTNDWSSFFPGQNYGMWPKALTMELVCFDVWPIQNALRQSLKHVLVMGSERLDPSLRSMMLAITLLKKFGVICLPASSSSVKILIVLGGVDNNREVFVYIPYHQSNLLSEYVRLKQTNFVIDRHSPSSRVSNFAQFFPDQHQLDTHNSQQLFQHYYFTSPYISNPTPPTLSNFEAGASRIRYHQNQTFYSEEPPISSIHKNMGEESADPINLKFPSIQDVKNINHSSSPAAPPFIDQSNDSFVSHMGNHLSDFI